MRGSNSQEKVKLLRGMIFRLCAMCYVLGSRLSRKRFSGVLDMFSSLEVKVLYST